jgi:hypothetical protein
MKTMLARFGLLSLAATAALGAGCAQERDPINRVQANALPKAFFLGNDLKSADDDPEFRMKGYTIGSSVSQSAYTIGEFTAVDRVRWEVTEDMLLARRAYQEVEGADNRGIPKEDWDKHEGDKTFSKTATGTIVAAYKIDSHFDIRREYNAQTGEEMNVIGENTSDRPWNEREYMRIDWSKNLVASTNDSTRYFGLAKATPVEYSVTDPASEDAPHVEVENGYFDVTNKFTVEPEQIEFSWGTLPACVLAGFVTGSPSYDCNPQEATLRMSFARIDKDEDFERFEDTTAWRDIVGNWGGSGDGANPWLGAPRQKWDPAYGATDALTKRFKAIHNLWKKSHQDATCASNADANKDGTADACANDVTGYSGNTGSQCDVYVNKCTIPVRDREVRTVGYVLNREAPDALQDEVDGEGNFVKLGTLEDLTTSWNQLLEVSVAYRREVECRRTGGARAACHAEFFDSTDAPATKTMVSYGGWLIDKVKKLDVDKGKPVLTACHNPVRSYDPKEACGEPGTVSRFGDIRKNFLVYWPFESKARYGGVGANPPDPLTGETFGATATIMGRSATYAAGMQRDIVQLALGDLKMQDIIDGVPTERYASMLANGLAAPEGLTHATSAGELTRKVSEADVAGLRARTGLRTYEGTNAVARGLAETRTKAKSGPNAQALETSIVELDALASRLRGTPFEAQVADNRWMTGVLGASPNASPSPQMMDLASPLRGMDPARVDAMHAWFGEQAAARGQCFHDSTLAGAGSVYQPTLAGFFRAKYGSLDPKTRGERIYEDLWKEAVKGVGLHELGHSLGLRHNFASSWDAPNYNPQYWQLRTAEGRAKQACKGPRADGDDTCMGPRYLDPMTRDEQGLGDESRPGIDYFANTSTMEYQLERFGETVGLGGYDLHAMKTLYGRVLESFDDKVVPATQQESYAAKTFTQLQERDIVVHEGKIFSHYTTTARLMNVFDPARDCRPATPEEKEKAAWRIVHGKVCGHAPKDHGAFEDYTTDDIPGTGIAGVKWHADVKGKQLVRWPYRYGEQYGSGGYMHTTMGDAGADIYELVQNLQARFDLTYPWSYFRRGNRDWSHMFIPQATSSRYLSRVRAYHWQIATDLGRAQAADLGDDDGLRPYVMAQGDIFNFLARAILMPEPGPYRTSVERTPVGSGRTIFDLSTDRDPRRTAFELGIVDGRYIGEDFDNALGGSWDYQKYVHHAGYEVEKAMAMMQIVDPRPTLFTVQRENFLDGRGTKISFRTDLPGAVDRLLGGILAEDWETIAPAVSGETSPTAGAELAPRMLDLTPSTAKRTEPGARIVFPNVGYKQQLTMAIYAALLSRVGSDMTLVNKLRVWIDGDRAPALPGVRQVKMTDPLTGYTYIAGLFGADVVDGKTVDSGIGSRMLQHANEVIAATYKVKRDAVTRRAITDEFGRPELIVDANGKPQLEASGAAGNGTQLTGAEHETNLRRYIGLVDSLRQLQIALGTGPLGGPSDD